MNFLYRSFFLFYGGVHVLAGFVIAWRPAVLAPVLYEPPARGVGVLLGFLSALAGLAFLGAAYVNDSKSRRIFLWLAILGNLLNGLAHLANVARGDSPPYMLLPAGALAVVVVVLSQMLRALHAAEATSASGPQ